MRFHPLHLAVLAGASLAQENGTNANLTAALADTQELSLLNTLVGQFPELISTLTNASNITIFAPSNSALEPLANDAQYQALSAQPGFVQSFLTYHVLNQTVFASNVTETPAFLHTLLTNTTLTNVTGGQVVEARLRGDNVTLTSGLGFRANVTRANVNITNGVIHIIDNILFPPANVSSTAVEGGLTALVGALAATNLTDVVDQTPDLTIFAPNNAAFEDIGSLLANLTAEQAASILQYHVINGTVAYSSLLSNGTSVDTITGASVNITIEDGEVFVNSARVIAADVLVANGVVHVIDAVLNPNSTQRPNPDESSGVPAYSGASSGAVPYTSGVPTPSGTTQVFSTTDAVASGYSNVPSGALGSASSSIASAASSTSSGTAAHVTGVIGAAALFGGAAVIAQW